MPPNLMPRRQSGASVVTEDRPPEVFGLSISERQSAGWQKIKAELQRRLAVKREDNDGKLDPVQTERVRGHIECLKEIIALGDDPPPFEE